MMLGERTHHLSPTIQVPPWPVYDDLPPSPASSYSAAFTTSLGSPPSASSSPMGGDLLSPYLLNDAAFSTALQRFLPSNDLYLSDTDDPLDASSLCGGDGTAAPLVDAYSCDEFRMYEFKVRRCARGRSHDWTECPYAHPGEKARRRDPRKYHYSGTACPDFRKGSCKRGDSCEFAHGVFECWLHPARYRTQPCKDGVGCRRRVCFFAHTPEQLRVLPPHSSSNNGGCGLAGSGAVQSPRSAAVDSYDGSPLRKQQQQHLATLEAYFPSSLGLSSPSSIGSSANNNSNLVMSPPLSPPSGDSPPLSPSSGAPSSIRRTSLPSASINEIVVSLRQLQLCKAKSAPSSWGGLQQQQLQVGSVSRSATGLAAAAYPVSGFNSLPSTPTRLAVMNSAGGCAGLFDGWGEEQQMERVESGRDLRARMAEKLTKENPLECCSGSMPVPAAPDVDWVSELLM